jgi:hypothetical protein
VAFDDPATDTCNAGESVEASTADDRGVSGARDVATDQMVSRHEKKSVSGATTKSRIFRSHRTTVSGSEEAPRNDALATEVGVAFQYA